MPQLRVLLVLFGLLTAGCAGASASAGGPHPPSDPPCRTPPPAVVPGGSATLDQTASGAFCLTVGQRIDVFLTSPQGNKPGVTRWSRISTSDPGVLAPRSSGILTSPVGVTPGIFQAQAPGTARLSSAVPGTPHTWQVTIRVR